MALGDFMASSRFSQSTVLLVPNHHLDHDSASSSSTLTTAAAIHEDAADFHRRDSEVAAASSSYGNASASAAATSMAYLPQMVVLCELRHDAFESSVRTGPSDSGLVSKWKPKDRVSFWIEVQYSVSWLRKCTVILTGFRLFTIYNTAYYLFLCYLHCAMINWWFILMSEISIISKSCVLHNRNWKLCQQLLTPLHQGPPLDGL